jgi:hypothetical protein
MPKRASLARFTVVALACLAPALHPAPAAAQGVPQFDPSALATAWMSMTYEQLRPIISQLPCPLPGLPPQLSKLVDCSVLRPIPDATRHQPVPPPQGGTPTGVDHRTQGLVGSVRDQGMVGSCEANAIASLIDTYTRLRRLNATPASALHVFAIYERTNLGGVDRDDVGNLTRVPGVTTEAVWPYDAPKACRIALSGEASGCDAEYHVQLLSGYTDPAIVAERKRADATPAYRITGIEVIAEKGRDGVPINVAAAEAEIMKLLASGEAVLLGVDMAQNWTSAGGVRNGVEVLPQPQGYYGSHALLAQGYRTTPSGTQFLVQNSWGTSWGQGGFAWIPEDILRARLRDAYRFNVQLTTDAGNVAVAPPPAAAPATPPSAPPAAQAPAAPAATQGCPPGYAPVFGVCAPALAPCAAGTVPSLTNPCLPH